MPQEKPWKSLLVLFFAAPPAYYELFVAAPAHGWDTGAYWWSLAAGIVCAGTALGALANLLTTPRKD